MVFAGTQLFNQRFDRGRNAIPYGFVAFRENAYAHRGCRVLGVGHWEIVLVLMLVLGRWAFRNSGVRTGNALGTGRTGLGF